MNIIALGQLYNNNKTCVLECNILIVYTQTNNNNDNIVPRHMSSYFNSLSKLI